MSGHILVWDGYMASVELISHVVECVGITQRQMQSLKDCMSYLIRIPQLSYGQQGSYHARCELFIKHEKAW